MNVTEAARAARILKIVRLANSPGMDVVSVKLNSELTYEEEKEAERWYRAIELAKNKDKTIYQLAHQFYQERRYG